MFCPIARDLISLSDHAFFAEFSLCLEVPPMPPA